MKPERRARLGILSRRRSLYSTRRLVEAARGLGVRPLVLDTLQCTLVVGGAESKLLYRGARVHSLAAVIPRIGASITSYGIAVVNHLEGMGVRVLNPGQALAKSRDKVRSLQLLAAGGIDVPRTAMVPQQRRGLRRVVDELGGLPCIIKLLKGTQGVGVMIANSYAELETFVRTFSELGQEVCVQEFIAESRGRDIRAVVVGERVVGAMRRTARDGEFRSNLHRGGSGERVTLEAPYERAAVESAKLLGLDVCGVDMLEGASGPKVMELNSSPGFEGIERATGEDVASAVVRHALQIPP